MTTEQLYDTILQQTEKVRAIIDKATADESLTLAELGGIIQGFCRAGVKIVERIEVAGPERRRLVTDALLRLWDEKLAKLDMPGPDAVLDPWFRSSIPIWGGWVIDQLVALYNAIGWDL